MNDYKELIEKLRNQECLECVMWDDEQGCASMSTCIMFQQAADAIEQLAEEVAILTKERDAAIVDKNNLRVSWPIINASIGRSLELRYVKDALERVKKERDAAVADLTDTATHGECVACKHFDNSDSVFCQECRLHSESKWEWRGVQEDNDGNT